MGEGSLHSGPTPWKAKLGRKSTRRLWTRRLQISYFLCPEEEVDARESPDYHLLPKLLREAPVWVFYLRDARAVLYRVSVMSRFFPRHFGFLFWCVWGVEEGRGDKV